MSMAYPSRMEGSGPDAQEIVGLVMCRFQRQREKRSVEPALRASEGAADGDTLGPWQGDPLGACDCIMLGVLDGN